MRRQQNEQIITVINSSHQVVDRVIALDTVSAELELASRHPRARIIQYSRGRYLAFESSETASGLASRVKH